MSRPIYFNWTNAKQSGHGFNLTAAEWNALTANINAVRTYKNHTTYSFTEALSGNTFNASMYNQAVIAIQEIMGYGTHLYMVSPGDIVYASKLNVLVSEINAVP